MKVCGQRKCNEQSNNEPAVVKANRDASDSTQLDLCLHWLSDLTRGAAQGAKSDVRSLL